MDNRRRQRFHEMNEREQRRAYYAKMTTDPLADSSAYDYADTE